MDKQKYFNSSLKEKEINQNFRETINKFKKGIPLILKGF